MPKINIKQLSEQVLTESEFAPINSGIQAELVALSGMITSLEAEGTGDMLKSVYDSAGVSGVVDVAEALKKGSVEMDQDAIKAFAIAMGIAL